jgi:hypothetical protein
MCNQTVGLVQAAIEREGISTVSVTLLHAHSTSLILLVFHSESLTIQLSSTG